GFALREISGGLPDRTKCIGGRGGRLVASGDYVFSPDLRQAVARLPGPAATFLTGRPVLVTVRDRTVTLLSVNTFKPLGSAELLDTRKIGNTRDPATILGDVSGHLLPGPTHELFQ